jgi:predicted nucleotidyltransferase
MKRQDALNVLNAHREDIARQFGVKVLAVFGSVARDEARPDSDLDVLVTFEGRARFDPFMQLKAYLERVCGVHVDLVTLNSLRPEMRPQIEQEAVYVS